ncbi:hypothetical protein [Actinocrispum wychmicini]|uniref:hypothetical protein n=1 Tax=Actinocrispum wychmicini TaxID=1213861 RepID=UPI00104A63C5|nr:hypothetical protein [Actinocrispum wychmicini]
MRLLRSPMVLIGVGLALVLIGGFGFTSIVTRAVPDSNTVAAVTSLYFLVNTLALGVFSGVELEMSRSVSQERTLGNPIRPVAHSVARQATRLWLLAAVILLAVSPILVSGPLRGHWELAAELMLSLVAALFSAVVRGALAGSQRFGFYSATMAAEGLSRLLPCVVLYAVGVDAGWVYGLVFALGHMFSALVGVLLIWLSGLRGWHRIEPGTVLPKIGGQGAIRFGLSTALLLVVLANSANQGIVNLPPVIVNHRLISDTATAVGLAVMLTRLPMFAVMPLQTMLLPRLTASAARGDLGGVRKQNLRTVAVCVVLGLIGIVVLATAGPTLLSIYQGRPAELSATTMAGLGVGTLFLTAMNITQPALLALSRHRAVLVSYLSGLAAMVVAAVLPIDPIASVVLSASAGPIVASIVMAVVLFRATSDAAVVPNLQKTAS